MGESTNPRRGMNEYKPVGGVIMGRKFTPLEELRRMEDRMLEMQPSARRNELIGLLRRQHNELMDELVVSDG